MKRIYAIATLDTKGAELAYLTQCMRNRGAQVCTIDVSTLSQSSFPCDVSRESMMAAHPQGKMVFAGVADRGQAITKMSEALIEWLKREYAQGNVAGVVGIGGSGGTALIAPAFQSLPIGVPKLLVSTVASGNVNPYVGCTDLTMMYSVVDVAGLNIVSRQVLSNAAGAIVGMAQVAEAPLATNSRAAIGMTMFGVTTPCVTSVRAQLEQCGFDPLVFHATGTGGQAMEKLVESKLLSGVLDITTTEVADEVVGGVFPAGKARMDIILERKLPYVISLGALDMVNFGARETVPERFQQRRLHVHNAQVTLMRTTPSENLQIAHWIVRKLQQATSSVVLVIPEKGVSALDAPGQPFWDPEADAVLFDTLTERLRDHPHVRVIRRPEHINDPAFAKCLAETFLKMESTAGQLPSSPTQP